MIMLQKSLFLSTFYAIQVCFLFERNEGNSEYKITGGVPLNNTDSFLLKDNTIILHLVSLTCFLQFGLCFET